MELLMNYFINGIGVGFGIIGCVVSLFIVSGVFAAIIGTIAVIADFINVKGNKK